MLPARSYCGQQHKLQGRGSDRSTDGAGLASDLCFHYDTRFKPYDGGAGGNTYITRAQEQLALPSSVAITGDLIWLCKSAG